MDKNTKIIFNKLFKALSLAHLKKEVYKITTFKHQETIEKLLEREKEYRKIIKTQASKHNDNQGVEEMEKMFSTMMIDLTTEEKRLMILNQ